VRAGIPAPEVLRMATLTPTIVTPSAIRASPSSLIPAWRPCEEYSRHPQHHHRNQGRKGLRSGRDRKTLGRKFVTHSRLADKHIRNRLKANGFPSVTPQDSPILSGRCHFSDNLVFLSQSALRYGARFAAGALSVNKFFPSLWQGV